MPDNQRTSSPKIVPRITWSTESFPTVDQEHKAVIRKFINSAVYVEKSVMPPLRKKSSIEITSFNDSEYRSRVVSTDRSVKRCRCITSPQSCPCHPVPELSPSHSGVVSESSTTSSSDLGSQITVKSKDCAKDNPRELKLSLSSLHSDKPPYLDTKEKEELIRNWLKKKDEEKKNRELAEKKIKEIKMKEKQIILEKERENFKRWLATKKLEEERAKAVKEKKEMNEKQKITEKEQRRNMNQFTYNQWLNRKKRTGLGEY